MPAVPVDYGSWTSSEREKTPKPAAPSSRADRYATIVFPGHGASADSHLGALATEDRGWTLLLAPLTGFTSWAGSFRPSAQSQGLAAFPGETCGGEEKGGATEGLEPGPRGPPGTTCQRPPALPGPFPGSNPGAKEASLSLRGQGREPRPGPQAQPWTVMPGATLIPPTASRGSWGLETAVGASR